MSVYVIGAGGHAKVVLSTLRAAGTEVAGLLEEEAPESNVEVMGYSVVGTVMEFSGKGHGAVIAIGDNAVRQRIAKEYEFEWISAVHPSAVVDSSATIEKGAVVFAGAVVQPMSRVGFHAILNTSCSVDHDCQIGDFSHIAPGAHLAGSVNLEAGVFVGCGATIVPRIKVGAWSIVGAGAVVIREVASGTAVAGCPAKPLRSAP